MYLFGTEEYNGLSRENLSANWNRSKINILFTQAGLINVRDET